MELGAFAPCCVGAVQRLPRELEAEVDHAGSAAEGGGDAPGREVVTGVHAAVGGIEMRMRVDAARKQVAAGGIDGPVGLDGE